MKGRLVFEQIAAAFDGHRAGTARYRQTDFHRDRYRRTDVNVLRVRAEPGGRHGQVIGVERHVRKTEIAGTVGCRGSLVLANRVVYGNGRTSDYGARRVGDRSGDVR